MPVKKEYTIKYGNKDLIVYPLGVLAEALGRTSRTVRQWEIAGIIPDTFRIPCNLGLMRVYTAEQIQIIVKNAEKYKIVKGKNISNTHFSRKLQSELADYMTKLNKECF